MRYVFDLDGTLCTLTDGQYDKAEPYVNRIENVNKLYAQGHYITVNTARGMSRFSNDSTKARDTFEKLTRLQLESWGLKFHDLFLGKPAGDVYIDDKALKDDDYFKDRIS